MLKIGTLKLSSNLILAPMAGITDLPFRLLCRKFGAELAFVEMINVRSISYKSKKTEQMLSAKRGDRPLGIQLLGSEAKFIQKAMDILIKKYKFDILDFNAACPARKVTRRGEGANLMREPKKLHELLKIIVKNSPVPVTVKIRSGWDKNSLNAKEVALAAQDAGISGLFIHGRTKLQEYSGTVDYKIIGQVKQALQIPVVGSGDVFSSQLVKKMLDETGCDGVAIARGALGNPWIFSQKIPDHNEVIKVMSGHLNSCIDFYGEKSAVVIFRKFFAWYTKGFSCVRHLREKVCRIKSKKEMFETFEELRNLSCIQNRPLSLR